LIYEGQVRGVLELASFQGFDPTHHAFLEQLAESIAIVLNTIDANMLTEDLLKQSQSLAHQLQTRQEELQKTNEELQEKARLLVSQNQEVERKNAEVEQARQELEEKARQLSLTSKYKSEFLANMSHELRTPLNSLLILSDQLSKNLEGNLTSKQTEFAKTIHSSGNDLLMLINDILDLSKIESGTVVVDAVDVSLENLKSFVERTFRHVGETKNVEFVVDFHHDLPPSIYTDAKRLQQILKNLLSNAFKFTQRGHVHLAVRTARGGWSADNESLCRAHAVLAFEVNDTGIGIAPDKQQIIFEAFQQADGSTSRKFGGTGLGLAISRELSRLLGGEIRLVSAPGRGSNFTLYLPSSYNPSRGLRKLSPDEPRPAASSPLAARLAPAGSEQAEPAAGNGRRTMVDSAPPEPEIEALVNEAGDDRDAIQPRDRVLLIVENDVGFARFLLDAAREKGIKGIVTSLGASALALIREYKPQAITLDLHLPDIDGWRVLERLKGDVALRHIPVCVISTDESRQRAFAAGAAAFLSKPLPSRDPLDRLLECLGRFMARLARNVLVIDPDEERRMRLVKALDEKGMQLTVVADAKQAGDLLRAQAFDCVVAGAGAEHLAAELESAEVGPLMEFGRLPVILYNQGEHDVQAWRPLVETCAVYPVHSTDRLLDMTALHGHLNVAMLEEGKRQALVDLHDSDKPLAGRKVLIVDDDMRNIFALSTVLEDHEMQVVSADNGRDAIRILQHEMDVDIVLMDIMMPEMDGMETMREIRKLSGLKNLPIVAVTAKAMKGDREKCIEAGAWDYLSKPVDADRMLAVLRAWLHR
jgi:signal transduction histidine kinase/CheY-like chemotaxis protein